MRVYLALGSTDLRKAINGLSVLVEQAMGLDPFCGDLFVFCNRRQNIIKILSSNTWTYGMSSANRLHAPTARRLKPLLSLIIPQRIARMIT